MRTVYEAVDTVSRLCGEQKRKPGAEYRLSLYALTVPCAEGTVLYHTMTGKMLLLSPGEGMAENEEALLADWFLAPVDCDEKKRADDLRRILRMMNSRPKRKTEYTIVTTTDCNARCFYCYERGIRKLWMTPETARDVADYIDRTRAKGEIKLKWFGGEPFYNAEAVDTICAELQARGVEYTSVATSNGYFLDAETCRRAKEDWRLRSVQITVDGTEQAYNRTKAYIDCPESAYARVMENIGCALDAGIRVTIRLNLHRENGDDLLALCDELNARFGGREGWILHVVNLKKPGGQGSFLDDPEAAARYAGRIRQKAEAMGAWPKIGLMRGIVDNQCMADNDACDAIYPDGSLGRCENYSEKETVGSIYSEERNEAVIRSWKERFAFPECETCAVYPCCIRLKKCFWQDGRCGGEAQKRRIEQIKEMVRQTYEDSKKQEEKNENKG